MIRSVKKKYPVNVFETLNRIFSGKISQLELNRFIEFCCQVAHCYVLAEKDKLTYRLKDDSLNTFDIAVRAVSPFFLVNKDGEFGSLRKAFQNWSPKIEEENNATFFLNKIIQKKTKQLIGDVYKESNPFFNKTLDSILYYLSVYKLNKTQLREQVYITKKGFNRTNFSSISQEEFKQIPISCFTEDKKMFDNLFKLLAKRKYSQAIPLYMLAWRLVEIKRELFEIPTEEDAGFLSRQIADEILELGLEHTLKKLEDSYLKKKKIKQREFNIYSSALRDIVEDLKYGAGKKKLIEYLRPYVKKNLSVEEFDDNYRNTFEYLEKLFKKEMLKLYKA